MENTEVSPFFSERKKQPLSLFEGWSGEATGDCFLWVVVRFLLQSMVSASAVTRT